MAQRNSLLLGTIVVSVCLLFALPGCQNPNAGPEWKFDSGQPDAADQKDVGVDSEPWAMRDAFRFDLPEPPNIDAGDWMPPGASEECTPRPEAEGRCYTRFIPQSLEHRYPDAGPYCRVVEYSRTDEGRMNSFQQYRVDRNDCGEPVRVLEDFDSWEERQDGEPLDGLPSYTYGYVYDAEGHPKEYVSPGNPVDIDKRFYFGEKERLFRIKNVSEYNRTTISFDYDSQGNRTRRGAREMSYDSECRITSEVEPEEGSIGSMTWTYPEVDDGLVVIQRVDFREEVETDLLFMKRKRLIEDGRLVKIVAWTKRGSPSQGPPDEEDWNKTEETLFYYDAHGRRIARVNYGEPKSNRPATPRWVTRYYYDCAWSE